MAPATGPKQLPDTLRVSAILFAPQSCRLLVTRCNDDRERYLPRFVYSRQLRTSEQCCRDLQDLLALPRGARRSEGLGLEVVAELLPDDFDSTGYMYNPGIGRVTLLQSQTADDFPGGPLRDGMEWMDVAEFYHALLDEPDYEYEYACERQMLLHFLGQCTQLSSPNVNNACSHTRILESRRWVEALVHARGGTMLSNMQRHPGSSFALVFAIQTTEGRLFLKTPPPGSSESVVTATVARLLPRDTLEVMAVNGELDCFLAKAFQTIHGFTDKQRLLAARKLARMQIHCVQHVRALERGQVPNRSPAALSQRVDECMRHPAFAAALQNRALSARPAADMLIAMCNRLEKSQIPQTLVHGDFGEHNVAMRTDVDEDEGIIVFDWQFACISHPFCDFMDEFRMSGWEVRREYLKQWEKIARWEELLSDLEDAKCVGWLVRFVTVMEWLQGREDESMRYLQSALSMCASRLLGALEKRSSSV